MKDVGEYCRQCDLCRHMGQPNGKDCMPHQSVLSHEPFQKWGLDFVRPFKLATTRTWNRYIIVVTDYCTKWVEVKALCDDTAASTAKFLYERIWYHFGCQGIHFVNKVIYELSHYYAMVHKRSTSYYQQANGLADRTD